MPTMGSFVGPNSVLDAPDRPAVFRAPSIHAICMPRQMPKNGTSRSRANLTAAIFPSEPRSPNPPGTKMAFIGSSAVAMSSSDCSNNSASIHLMLTLTRLDKPPCVKASLRDLYASARPTYLPTTPMVTSPSGLDCRSMISSQRLRSGSPSDSRPNARSTSLSSPSI